LAVEEFEHHSLAKIRKRWIVTVSLIAHESVGAVQFYPLEVGTDLLEARFDTVAALQRNVRILPAPEM
jgi:hypothetical protein